MANYYNPYKSIPNAAFSITSKDIEEVLLQAKKDIPEHASFINELLETNSEMADFIDSISDQQAYTLLCNLLTDE